MQELFFSIVAICIEFLYHKSNINISKMSVSDLYKWRIISPAANWQQIYKKNIQKLCIELVNYDVLKQIK